MKFPLLVVLAVSAAASATVEAQSCAHVASRSASLSREAADAEALRIVANARRHVTAYDLCRTLGEAIDMTRSVSTARVVLEAAAGLRGDFERAEVLVTAAGRGLLEERTSDAFFTVARGIEDDYQLRRALSAAIRVATSSPPVLQQILSGSVAIDDDYQLATLLTDVAQATPLTGADRERYLSVARMLRSDWEYRRATSALSARSGALR
jgi:hypothetical protein